MDLNLRELSPKIASKKRVKKRALNLLDSCISLFIVSPLVVAFWKGLWNNIEHYDLEYRCFPLWKWLAISYAVSTFVYYARDSLEEKIMHASDSHCKSIYLKGLRRAVIYRVYHYVFAFSSIMMWRCLWEILPRYGGTDVYPAIVLSVVCFIPLVLMRSVRNLVAPPILIITDSKEFAFNFPTRYRIDFYTGAMTCHSLFLEVLDTLFASFVVGPLVVTYWRGTWNLSDKFLLPHDKLHSSFASLVIGLIGHLIFTTFQGFLKGLFSPHRHRLTFYVGSRLYTSIFAVICVNTWRGGWQLIDKYTARDTMTVISITILAILALMALKTLKNVMAPPFVVVTDTAGEYFDIPTMYKKSGTREPGLYIFDCLFSVLVIGSLVVFVWRGLWVLLDTQLFPEDVTKSYWASLIIGYAIVGITFSLQPVMKWACERLEGFWRVIVADVFLFVSFVGTVNVWRGIWGLLDVYFLPENKLLSDWITHGVSLVLLILLNCSNSVLVRGVYIDAEEPAGQCVIFPVYYIRLFFQKERTKKQKRVSEKTTERSEPNNTVLLIDNSQMNHSTSAVHTKIINISDDLKLTKNEFSESDRGEGGGDESKRSDEHKVILCGDE